MTIWRVRKEGSFWLTHIRRSQRKRLGLRGFFTINIMIHEAWILKDIIVINIIIIC